MVLAGVRDDPVGQVSTDPKHGARVRRVARRLVTLARNEVGRDGYDVIGIVLAAGAGRRLAPLTDDLPKTLLEVDGSTTILDIALANLAGVGIDEVVVISGFAAHRIHARVPD